MRKYTTFLIVNCQLSIINSYAAAHFSFFSGVQRYDILAIKAKKAVNY